MLLGSGCSTPTGTDQDLHDRMARYRAVLEDVRTPPAERLERCLALPDPDLAGDCALAMTRAAARQDRSTLATLCPRLPEGIWRSECWFEMAELVRSDDHADAVALCEQAGQFRDDCLQHLWQQPLRALVMRTGPQGFADGLPEAEALLREWEALQGASNEQTFRFWRHYYEAGFGGMTPLDLGVCDPLPALQRERCLEAAVASYESRLRAAARDVGLEAALCAPGAPERLLRHLGSIHTDLQVAPHWRLEQALAAFREDSCPMLGWDASRPRGRGPG